MKLKWRQTGTHRCRFVPAGSAHWSTKHALETLQRKYAEAQDQRSPHPHRRPSGAAQDGGATGVFGAAVCGVQCRESHGSRMWGDFSLNTL